MYCSDQGYDYGNTTPTRCLTCGTKAKCSSVDFIPGIPFHGITTFEVETKVAKFPTTRLRRTALFELDDECSPVPPAELEKLKEFLEVEGFGCAPGSALPSVHWKRWHARAEVALNYAAEKGWVTKAVKAERPKGSPPSSRKTAVPACHRKNEPIVLRRLRRLGRKVAHRSKFEKCSPESKLRLPDFEQLSRAASLGVLWLLMGGQIMGRLLSVYLRP